MRGKTLIVASAILLIGSHLVSGQIANITVTSGASFEPGLPATFGLSTIFCTGLKVSGTVQATGFPLPTVLSGVRILIGSIPVPLLAVVDQPGYQQVNFQVGWGDEPGRLNGAFGHYITVEQDGQRATVFAPSRYTPGDFFLDGGGAAVFTHARDYRLVTEADPAVRGEIINAWLSGMGETTPGVPPGYPAFADPLSVFVFRVTPRFADRALMTFTTGSDVEVLFAGLAPGLVGVNQINFRIPEDAGSGRIGIALRRESCRSSSNVDGCLEPTNSAVTLWQRVTNTRRTIWIRP